jgi:hypothetical protein
MDAKEAIRSAMHMGLFVLDKYVADMSDADLLRRPAPGCNHLAWQLGHLISSEAGLIKSACPAHDVELPAGFREAHSKENTASDDPAHFRSKQEYLDLYKKVRARSLAALEEISDEGLAAPGPEQFRAVFPRVLDLFNLVATHPLMHAGQFVVVRRQLGKPVVI